MGNCHFKTEFEAENVTGNYTPWIFLYNFWYSPNQDQFHIPLLRWQGRIWKGVESRKEENKATICNERDE